MKTTPWLAFLIGLGPLTTGCGSDRPLHEATSDASQPSPSGAAGATAGTGGSGAAGTGASGAAGTGGGQGPPGCDEAVPILQQYSCSIQGACHEARYPAAGFSLAEINPPVTNVDWKAKLVGVYPNGGGVGELKSKCGSVGIPYLVPGSSPAKGLLLDKLFKEVPPCGAIMPYVGGPLTADERQCIQRWANALTAP